MSPALTPTWVKHLGAKNMDNVWWCHIVRRLCELQLSLVLLLVVHYSSLLWEGFFSTCKYQHERSLVRLFLFWWPPHYGMKLIFHFILLCTNIAWTFLAFLSVAHTVGNAVRPDSKPKLNEGIRATFLKRRSSGGVTFLQDKSKCFMGLSSNQAQHCSLGACWFVSNMAVYSPVVNTDTLSLSSFTIWATRPASHHLPSTGPSSLLSLLTLLCEQHRIRCV